MPTGKDSKKLNQCWSICNIVNFLMISYMFNLILELWIGLKLKIYGKTERIWECMPSPPSHGLIVKVLQQSHNAAVTSLSQ